jgi:D-alanyl-D-alanine carboxypeptidase/D-alanyl-D-alanine-endopeptidase (penicillin-binding protein 4)
MIRRFATALVLLCLLPVAVHAKLPAPVAQALARAAIPTSSVALTVQDVTARKPLIAVNADQSMNPASVMKLVTAFAALELLGPAYTWRTEVYLGGPLKDGVLHGDLILKGYGDPKLTIERFWLLLHTLRARGLREIRGDLVLDRSYFDPGPHDAAGFDNEPLRPYNVGADALLLNFKTVRFGFAPDAVTGQVSIFPQPPLAQLKLESHVVAVQGDCGDWRAGLTRLVAQENDSVNVRFSGTMPASCGERYWALSLLSGPQYAWGMFHAMWQELGGTLAGSVRNGLMPPGDPPFATIESATAAEVVRDMNKYSSNIIARQIFLTLSAEKWQPPGRYEASAQLVGTWLAQRGLDMPELLLENGSGLSRIERISAASLIELLVAAYRSPVMPEFIASLPLVAADGTMRRRLRDESVAGQAHVKTGSLADVRSLAGYVHTDDGRRLAFAFIVNHPNAGASQPAQDALLKWLHEYVEPVRGPRAGR